MAICRDLTKQPVEPGKKPIELLYWLDKKRSSSVPAAEYWQFLDKRFDIDNGRSIIAVYDEKNCSEDKKIFCVGYWNDGVAE